MNTHYLPPSPYHAISHRLRWLLSLALSGALTLCLLNLLAQAPLRLLLSPAALSATLEVHAHSIQAAPPSPLPPPKQATIPRKPLAKDAASTATGAAAVGHSREVLAKASAADVSKEPIAREAAQDEASNRWAADSANAEGREEKSDNATHQAIARKAQGSAELSGIDCPVQPKPRYPEAALAEGIFSGEVNARFLLAADGSVSKVLILSQQPAGYFEQAVRRAARSWQCSGKEGDSVKVSFPFFARSR